MKKKKALVTATIKLKYLANGEIVKSLENCWYDEAEQIAKSIVEEACLDLRADYISIEDIEYKLIDGGLSI